MEVSAELKKEVEDLILNSEINEDDKKSQIKKILEENFEEKDRAKALEEIMGVKSYTTPNFNSLTSDEQLSYNINIYADGEILNLKKLYAKIRH